MYSFAAGEPSPVL
jgi:hypothetical protein